MKSSLKILSGVVIIALMPMLAEAQRDGGQGQGQQNQDHSHGQGQNHRMHDGDMGQGMGMMNEEGSEQMQQMRALMQEIRQEEDPERRRELLQTHRWQMRAAMRMMNRGENGDGDPDRSMEERMKQMQRRMEMMQLMVEQMMENAEQESQGTSNNTE